MAEVFFYHLENRPLEAVLPALLLKTLERGWRAVVQTGSRERLEALDQHLWTFADESFLPHGVAGDAHDGEQPVLLTTDDGNANAATVRFLVDRAPTPAELGAYERVVLVFDGGDPDALADARATWKALKAASHAVTYWQQNARGSWERKA